MAAGVSQLCVSWLASLANLLASRGGNGWRVANVSMAAISSKAK